MKTSFYLGIAHEAKSQSQFAALFFKMFKKIIVYIPTTPIYKKNHTHTNQPPCSVLPKNTLFAKKYQKLLRKVMKKKLWIQTNKKMLQCPPKFIQKYIYPLPPYTPCVDEHLNAFFCCHFVYIHAQYYMLYY